MLNLWSACAEKLERELPPEQYKAWIKPIIFIGFEEASQQLKLGLPNQFKINCVKEQFINKIESVAKEIFHPQARIKLEIFRKKSEQPPKTKDLENELTNHLEEKTDTKSNHLPDIKDDSSCVIEKGALVGADGEELSDTQSVLQKISSDERKDENDYLPQDRFTKLRQELTFDSFIQGKANQMAWSAALQVVDKPGYSYNPLFLYGGVGLGKTHLAHAVGNAVLDRCKTARVRYIHAQEYFDEMVRGIQTKSIQDFKKKYQSLDLLLIDDIQFLGGKERTQEEFFYTFESLLASRKQLIITCDTYPKELSAFEERLVSRFGSGLIVEIEPPEFEMRVAILLKKSEQSGEKIPEEVAFFIAKSLRSNVRELEGALLRVLAFTRFRKTTLTLDLAKQALKDILELNRPPISIETIQKTVSDFFKIKISDMYSTKRPKNIARARQIAMYFAKELTQKSFPEIAERFGGRDHTTVMHAVKRIAGIRQHEQDLNRQLHVLEQMFHSGKM